MRTDSGCHAGARVIEPSRPPDSVAAPVDTHAHVFTRALPFAANRRYTPDYDATIGNFIAELDRHGVGQAVLVQPSFLGTDNRHMVEAIATAPDRLRGIAVVDPTASDRDLDDLRSAGVVGIRFNLMGDDPAKLARPEWRSLAQRAAARGWQIELDAYGRDLPRLLDLFAPFGAPIVLDHFGRPDPALGGDDPGFRRLSAAGPTGDIWVKLSGAYRCGGVDILSHARALISAVGTGRLLWGSDWPFTRFEDVRRYSDGTTELQRWLDDAEQAAVTATARQLFGFGSTRLSQP
jgi:predicted TIM-barrel fold metal-dependent hydrolase